MHRVSCLLIVLLFFPLAACSRLVEPEEDHRREPPEITLTRQQEQIIASENHFGLNLFREVQAREGDANLFISPLSVSMALGMALNGAAGDTRVEMVTALALAGLTPEEINTSYRDLIALLVDLDPNVTFEIANSVWYRPSFSIEQPFLDVNQTYFDAEIAALDFSSPEAPRTINRWVDEKTHGKIEEIIQGPIDPLTMLYLINAVYFKGDWLYRFDEDATRDDTFTRSDGSTVPVRMMRMPEVSLPYVATPTFEAVDLPYGDSLFSMTVLLPHEGQRLGDVVAELNQANWNEWMAGFQTHTFDRVELPRFRMEYEVELKDMLSALGIERAFDPGRSDFSAINPARDDLHISKVKHKTFVEVDERGTEAAAVTAIEISVTSSGPPRPIFRVDRPFLFVLREQATGTILFIGQVTHPAV